MGGAPCCCTARRFFKLIPTIYTGVGAPAKKNIAVRRNPPPKQNAALRNSGQGTMSLAGAGQSPQSFTASAVSTDRRNLFPHKQVADLRRLGVKGHCPLRVQGGARNLHRVSGQRRQAQFIPHISKSQTCAPLPPGNQTPPGVIHPSKQNAVLRLTAQRSTRLCRATFPPRTRPRRKAIGADSPPAPLPSKIPHALCNPPMVFRSSLPCPARFFL